MASVQDIISVTAKILLGNAIHAQVTLENWLLVEALNKYDLIYYRTFNEFIHPIQPFSNTWWKEYRSHQFHGKSMLKRLSEPLLWFECRRILFNNAMFATA